MFWLLIFDSEAVFISELYSFHTFGCNLENGWMSVYMKQFADKNRKKLEAKFADVFDTEINGLPTELRSILLDDMVTAFENRINVLNRPIQKVAC